MKKLEAGIVGGVVFALLNIVWGAVASLPNFPTFQFWPFLFSALIGGGVAGYLGRAEAVRKHAINAFAGLYAGLVGGLSLIYFAYTLVAFGQFLDISQFAIVWVVGAVVSMIMGIIIGTIAEKGVA